MGAKLRDSENPSKYPEIRNFFWSLQLIIAIKLNTQREISYISKHAHIIFFK